jgi:ATP-dependent RNA helicase DDX5/DBP2
LAPTRELSTQILDEAVKFGRRLGIRCVCCYGGTPKYPQIAAVAKGVDCIIATPGRLNDLITMKRINLTAIKFLVLDEVRACHSSICALVNFRLLTLSLAHAISASL